MDARDELEKSLADLRTHDTDPQRAEQIRVRCLAALETQRCRDHKGQLRLADWPRRLEPAAAFGLYCLYLSAAVDSSLALLR